MHPSASRPRTPAIRPVVAALQAYVPGEQPKRRGLIKLNTNENPYPPAEKVLRAVRQAVDGRLRLYPNPTSQALRQALADLHHCAPENVLVGNGCDEILALAVRAFVEPLGSSRTEAACTVQYLIPSYSLYPVLAAMHGARQRPIPLQPDYALPQPSALRRAGWKPSAALTLVTTPNAPSGRGYSRRDLESLCGLSRGVVLLDETYADFAAEAALDLALNHPHVLVARTFSKAYSLCFQRVGYVVGPPPLVAALDKIRDSYNVNGLGQVAALATLQSLPYYQRNFAKIIATRQRVTQALLQAGFDVLPSQTNFLFARPPGPEAEQWFLALRRRGILVRWFSDPTLKDRLRITIGTDSEMDRFLAVVSGLKAGRGW